MSIPPGQRGEGGRDIDLQPKLKHPLAAPSASSALLRPNHHSNRAGDSDDAVSVSSATSSLGSLELEDSECAQKSKQSSYLQVCRRSKVNETAAGNGALSSASFLPVAQKLLRHNTEATAPHLPDSTQATTSGNAEIGTRWPCPVCKIVSFRSAEEALAHEKMCFAVRRDLHHRALATERKASLDHIERSQQVLLAQPSRDANLLRQLAQQHQLVQQHQLLQQHQLAATQPDPLYAAQLRNHHQQEMYQRAILAGLQPPASSVSHRTPAEVLLQHRLEIASAANLSPAAAAAYPPPALSEAAAVAYHLQQPPSAAFHSYSAVPTPAVGPSAREAQLPHNSAGVLPIIRPATGMGIVPLIPDVNTLGSPSFGHPFANPRELRHARNHPKRLALPDDANYLNERECFLRSDCLELFEATEEDAVAARNGRRKPVKIGHVGLRCTFCSIAKTNGMITGAHRAACYPSSIRFIRKSLDNWRENHFSSCPNIPNSLKDSYGSLGRQGSTNAEQYRIHAAKNLGLVDCTGGGIRFLG